MWRVITAALLTAAGTAIPPPASAASNAAFEGKCTMAGMVSFAPRATLVPQPGSSSADLRGTCTGTLNVGAATLAVDKAPSRYTASAASSAMSCSGGTSAGSGRLSVQGVGVDFTLREARLAPVALLTLNGGTEMTGIVTVDPANGADAATACTGSGLASADVTAQFSAR